MSELKDKIDELEIRITELEYLIRLFHPFGPYKEFEEWEKSVESMEVSSEQFEWDVNASDNRREHCYPDFQYCIPLKTRGKLCGLAKVYTFRKY